MKLILYNLYFSIKYSYWGWGLGIGDWGLGPIPNPQSPIPNPQSPLILDLFNLNLFYSSFNFNYLIKVNFLCTFFIK
jgi:hypothetical protein